MRSIYVGLGALLGVALARPAPYGHVQHEVRKVQPEHPWRKRGGVDTDMRVPVRIGLVQENLEQGAEMLMDFSHPESPNYGKRLDSYEIAKLFAPSQQRIDAVGTWLSESLGDRRITLSPSRQWYQFDATIAELGNLVHADYHEYEHHTTGETSLGCDEYHVPIYIAEHLDFVTPGVKTLKTVKRNRHARRDRSVAPIGPKVTKLPDFLAESSGGGAPCSYAVTPACVRALYNITDSNPGNKDNSIGIYENEDQFYNQTDLNLFFSTFASNIPQGTHPVYDKIDGAPPPIGPMYYVSAEGDLDSQAIFPLAYPDKVVEFQTDDTYWETVGAPDVTGLFNTFLDALDKSYCTYSAFGLSGDSPGLDASYPDKNPQGYDHPEQCGAYTPTNVISMSWTEDSDTLPLNYQCHEWMKLALQGVSVVVSSSDFGVAPRSGVCERNNTLFATDSPVDCPYITAVGATTLPVGGTPGKTSEVASNDFPSGGGFSNIFGQPSYQANAVNSFFKSHPPPYPYYNVTLNATHTHGLYNRGGRGYPDVSAIGQNFAIYFQNGAYSASGTSVSAPTFAAMVARINAARMNAGKKAIGFLNPILYAHPEIFNDITSGDNPGCGTNGFSAVKGWDPVTGLGTPNYGKMKDLFMSLP